VHFIECDNLAVGTIKENVDVVRGAIVCGVDASANSETTNETSETSETNGNYARLVRAMETEREW